MNVVQTAIPDVLMIEPRVLGDARGFFLEGYNARGFRQATGLSVDFVQDNHSRSRRGVLRGLHYQVRQAQGKLVSVVCGAMFDVAVDIRRSSQSFGQWVGVELSEDNHRQVWLPPGIAHGFLVLSERVDVLYKTTDYYASEHERVILWNDPDIDIEWPLAGPPLLSPKDQAGLPLEQAECFP